MLPMCATNVDTYTGAASVHLHSMDEVKQRKQNVLAKINSVLLIAGLNDTVWSIRDCDSTLFVLVYKKLFGKLPGILTSPASLDEHTHNFGIVLSAISCDVLEMDLSHISPQELAQGDLQALQNLAEIFSELCDILLQREDERSAQMRLPPHPTQSSRPASAVPASMGSTRRQQTSDQGRPMSASLPRTSQEAPLTPRSAATGLSASALRNDTGLESDEAQTLHWMQCNGRACVASTAESVSSGHRMDGAENPASNPISTGSNGEEKNPDNVERPETLTCSTNEKDEEAQSGDRFNLVAPATKRKAGNVGATFREPRLAAKAKPHPRTKRGTKQMVIGTKILHKGPSECAHLKRITDALSRRPRSAPSKAPASSATHRDKRNSSFYSPHLEREIAVLKERLGSRLRSEENFAGAIEKLQPDESANRISGACSAVVKQSLASVRRAEKREVVRGMAAERNAKHDAKTERLRQERWMGCIETARQGRELRQASKDEVSFRRLYQQALQLEKEKILLEASSSKEATRTVEMQRRIRQTALESYYSEQIMLLQEELQSESATMEFRERAHAHLEKRLQECRSQ
ncbi:hypothetical protein AB1Y20_013940 [Prymnesium parvum]|uniref:DUF5745 domain-containing protein n=1 Tax=Prymnesium parvum TaxID=97485 RepID=A0AB34IHG1_PRYPA